MPRPPAFVRNMGAVIDGLRERRGISQSDLARDCDVHRSEISLFVSGRRFPAPVKLFRIANALGIKVSRLIELAEDVG